MWSGSINEIPNGWALCNGANNTVDLRNRFVVGAGDTYSVGATGGFTDATLISHVHAATTNTAGGHSHVIPGRQSSDQFGDNTGTINRAQRGFSDTGIGNAGAHSHTVTVPSTGTSPTNANLPPYYALAFIQQIA
jgi:hypothetical protein